LVKLFTAGIYKFLGSLQRV